MVLAAAPVETGERVTLGSQVHARLAGMLVAGELSPGEKISLRNIADWLGVSMMPVREAVARLVSDEALEVLPNRAVRVPLMTVARFRELSTIRLAIEGFAVETAATCRSAADLMEIRRHDRDFRRECRASEQDTGAAVRANQALHFAVYRAARLPALIPIIEGLWLRIGPVLNLDMRASPERLRMGAAERSHGEMIAALDRHDAQGARAALESDIRGAADFIVSAGVLPS
jgi:DNA-binding GntR family transcriptional regulator